MDKGQLIYQWNTPDRIHYEKGALWYTVFGVLVMMIVFYGIVTSSLMMSFAFITLSGLYFLIQSSGERLIQIEIYTFGISVDAIFIPFSEIKYFYIVNEQQFKSLHIQTAKREKQLYLNNADPADVRDILIDRGIIEKTDQRESFSHILMRIFRI